MHYARIRVETHAYARDRCVLQLIERNYWAYLLHYAPIGASICVCPRQYALIRLLVVRTALKIITETQKCSEIHEYMKF